MCTILLVYCTFQGPYIYELFSIMIHSGSAAGGHYYAYIRYLFYLHFIFSIVFTIMNSETGSNQTSALSQVSKTD